MTQRTCADCGVPIARTPHQRGRPPLCCPSCQEQRKRERQKARQANRPQKVRQCQDCGQILTRREYNRRGTGRFYCETCEPFGRLARRSDDPSAPNRLTCKWCAQKLTGSQRRYCSTDCSDYDRGRRTVPTLRVCPVDGTEFEASGNKRFCSDRCSNRWSNNMHRYGVPPEEPGVSEFDCEWCGKHCVAGVDVVAHASRFCSVEHKRLWHHKHVGGQRVGAHQEARYRHWTGRLVAEPTRLQVAAYRRVLRADPCSYCGGPATALDHIDPRADGGEDGWANRTAACRECNSLKGKLTLLEALPWIPVATKYHAMRRHLYAA